MSPDRWRRIQILFGAVADLPRAERAAALEASGDAALHRDVEALLDAEDEARAFFESLGEALPDARASGASGPRRAAKADRRPRSA